MKRSGKTWGKKFKLVIEVLGQWTLDIRWWNENWMRTIRRSIDSMGICFFFVNSDFIFMANSMIFSIVIIAKTNRVRLRYDKVKIVNIHDVYVSNAGPVDFLWTKEILIEKIIYRTLKIELPIRIEQNHPHCNVNELFVLKNKCKMQRVLFSSVFFFHQAHTCKCTQVFYVARPMTPILFFILFFYRIEFFLITNHKLSVFH